MQVETPFRKATMRSHVPIWQEKGPQKHHNAKSTHTENQPHKILSARCWRHNDPAFKTSRKEMEHTVTMLQSSTAKSTRYALGFLPSLRELLVPGFRRVVSVMRLSQQLSNIMEARTSSH